nr:hypothetical protein [Tanacetum cinerariifolium]
MAPKRMSQAEIEKLVADKVVEAIAADRAERNVMASTSGSESEEVSDSAGGIRVDNFKVIHFILNFHLPSSSSFISGSSSGSSSSSYHSTQPFILFGVASAAGANSLWSGG